jgi:hypothetical protein
VLFVRHSEKWLFTECNKALGKPVSGSNLTIPWCQQLQISGHYDHDGSPHLQEQETSHVLGKCIENPMQQKRSEIQRNRGHGSARFGLGRRKNCRQER